MTPTTTPIFPTETVHWIPPKDLVPNPLNPRGDVKPDADLTASIAERGVLQAISAFERDGKLIVIAGHRRRANAIAAKTKTVPVVVKAEPTVGEQLADMLVENDGELRKGISALQEAAAYQALIDAGWTQTAIAKKVSKAQSHVTKRLALLKLPEEIVDKVEAGKVTFDAAYELAKIANPRVIKDLCKYGNPSPYSLRNALEKQTRGDAAAKETIKLKAAGTRVVSLSQLGNGTAAVLPVDLYANDLGVKLTAIAVTDVKGHAKEPCHAVAVFPKRDKGAQTLPVCDNPAAHPKAPIVKFGGADWQKLTAANIKAQATKAKNAPEVESKPKVDTEAEAESRRQALAAAEARFDELKSRATERRAFLAKVIKTPGRPAQTRLLQIAISCASISANDDWFDEDIVFEILGIETPDTAASAALVNMFRGSPKDAARASLAVAVGILESRIFWRDNFAALYPYEQREEQYWHSLSGFARWILDAYFAWLESEGFTVGPIEKAALEECAQDTPA